MKNQVGLFLMLVIFFGGEAFSQSEMVEVKGGVFLPLYGGNSLVTVDDFSMDVYPITNAEFLEFVKEKPRWRRSKVKKLFADQNYLKQWDDDLSLAEEQSPNSPVTNISWYAAKNYCECQGKRLPTVDEWEYAGMASKSQRDARADADFTKFILSWYETPNTYNKVVGKGFKNYWGISDMHGLVWEWTLDFNSVMLSGESRKGGSGDANLYCGAAAVGVKDLKNYAAFMRYAFRGSMKANYAIKNLGFRCVKDTNSESSLN